MFYLVHQSGTACEPRTECDLFNMLHRPGNSVIFYRMDYERFRDLK